MPRWRQATVEDYDRVIAFFDELGLAAFRPMQRQCRRERKSLVLREKAKKQHADPEFNRRLRSGRKDAYSDPDKEAIRLKKFRESFRRNVRRALPVMTAEQRREYDRLTKDGAKRDDALHVVLDLPRRVTGVVLAVVPNPPLAGPAAGRSPPAPAQELERV